MWGGGEGTEEHASCFHPSPFPPPRPNGAQHAARKKGGKGILWGMLFFYLEVWGIFCYFRKNTDRKKRSFLHMVLSRFTSADAKT